MLVAVRRVGRRDTPWDPPRMLSKQSAEARSDIAALESQQPPHLFAAAAVAAGSVEGGTGIGDEGEWWDRAAGVSSAGVDTDYQTLRGEALGGGRRGGCMERPSSELARRQIQGRTMIAL